MAVRSAPKGYHSLTLALAVRDVAAAIDFYKQAFGAVEYLRLALPDGSIMHAELGIGDSKLMLGEESDEEGGPRCPRTLGGVTRAVYLYVADVDAGFKQAVKAGAKVQMPVADMFWGDRYGQVVDPSGHLWEIATPKRVSGRAADGAQRRKRPRVRTAARRSGARPKAGR